MTTCPRVQLRPPKDAVAADASPDDVRLSRALLLAVGERCSAVRGPRHLEDPVVSPDGLHAQAAPRRPAVLQILDELSDSSKERFLRVAVERSEFPSEHALPFVGRHDGDRRRCERKSARTAVDGPRRGRPPRAAQPGTRPRRRTPGRVCPRLGPLRSAALRRTATGFRSPASAVSPSRWASSGMAPPPAKGSRIGGGPSGKHRSISARASASTSGLLEFSHFTSRSRILKSRSRSASCSAGDSDGSPDGSSTSDAQITARAAANGRRAHQRCNVDGCPCRIDFSRAASRLMAANGNATSINFGRCAAKTRHRIGWHGDRWRKDGRQQRELHRLGPWRGYRRLLADVLRAEA